MGTVDTFQYVHLVQQDGGALDGRAAYYTDDTVFIPTPDTDTDTAQFTDTDQTSETLQTWDTDVAQTTDILDTQDIQDTQAKH